MNQKGDNLGPNGHPGHGKNHVWYFITEVGSLRFFNRVRILQKDSISHSSRRGSDGLALAHPM